ncbi:hypothetical protein [Posidoniimonas polymericola]|uniref:hypothetical protein n=1 Tax=Posidoniimonas polymericola TaxID=2528002 RepID=UPI0011B81430|nr:hypothetical protein [Posidoniimonas polymericola]
MRALIHRSFDAPLTDVEVTELEDALKSNQDAQRLYCELSLLGADLVARKQAASFCKEVQSELPDAEVLPLPRRRSRTSSLRRFIPRSAAAMLALGIGLGGSVGLIAATLGYQQNGPRFFPLPWKWEVENDVVAKIDATHNLVWQTSEAPETPPTRGLRGGDQIRISEGWLRLAYKSGVSLMLQGPAVYEVRSEHGGKLFAGTCSVVVPSGASPLHLEINSGRLQVGPGYVGISDAGSAEGRAAAVHVFSGATFGSAVVQYRGLEGEPVELEDGEAALLGDFGLVDRISLATEEQFPRDIPGQRPGRYTGDKLYLGNLFDDGTTTSLAEAMVTDQYQAAAETTDLGVAAVIDGGLDVDVRLAEDGVWFNFVSVGGGGAAVLGLPGNDTYRSLLSVPIRTTGEDQPIVRVYELTVEGATEKIEEGIGISSNELLTFDLDEVRRAGSLRGRAMRFVSDRAGINDREAPAYNSRKDALANLVVVVSTEHTVLSAYLNGVEVPVVKRGEVFSVDASSGRAGMPGLRYDGHYVRFDAPIPAEARFLTLVSTDLGKTLHDHTVFSGARLEIDPIPPNQAARLSQ